MSEAADTRYNLVFAGKLLPGTDQARAERTLAAFFGLADPAAVRVFFSGRPVSLRRGLDREEALHLYHQLRSVGLICQVPPANRAGVGETANLEQGDEQAATSADVGAGVAPELELDLEPKPKPEPEPEPKRKPRRGARRKRKPKPRAKPRPIPKQRQKREPKRELEPEPGPGREAKPEANAKSGSRQEPESRPEPQPESRPKPESKPGLKLKTEPESKPRSKTKLESKSQPNPAPKPAPESESKPKPKPESKPRSKARSKLESKSKPNPEPESTPKPTEASPEPAAAVATAGKRTPLAHSEPSATRVADTTLAVPATGVADSPSATRTPGNVATSSGRAPNFFALRPARAAAGEELRTQVVSRALVLAAIAVALCLIVVVIKLRFPAAPPGAAPNGPLATASLPGGGLGLLLDNALLLHARSGLPHRRIDATTLELAALAAPLLASADGSLLLRGRAPGEAPWQLLRCQISTDTPVCTAVMPLPSPPVPLALRESYLGDALFLQLDDGRLLRSSREGDIEAAAAMSPSVTPAPMLYREGLLLIAAPDAPLLGVYRSDPGDFGKQLDALFLLTPTGAPPARRIVDIAATSGDRYALLEDDEGSRGLYHFDANWGTPRRVDLAMEPAADVYLGTWRDRLLLVSPTQRVQPRIAPGARAEAAYESAMLADEYAAWAHAMARYELFQRLGLIAPLLTALIVAVLAALQAASARALSRSPPARTALLDPMPAGIRWLPAAEDQTRAAGRLGDLLLAATVLAAIAAGLAGAGGRSACLLPAVLAAMQARVLLRRGCGGHFATLDGKIIAVDHDGRYFYGRDGQLRRGPGFLFAGAVAIPVAIPGLEALSPRALPARTRTIDAATATGLLWHLEHPWMRALVLVSLGILASFGAWLLTG